MKETVAEHRNYLRRERIKEDLNQTMFQKTKTEVTITSNPNKYAKPKETPIDLYQKVTCPFCLGIENLNNFLQSSKKGINKLNGKCPMCGLGMHLKTLIQMHKMTPEEYAHFVFDYRRSGFWQKIKFNTWKDRLFIMGWTRQFWDEYKKLKGENESYSDHMNRVCREEAEYAHQNFEENQEA